MSNAYTLDDLNVLSKALAYSRSAGQFQTTANGQTAIADNIFGINHRQIPTAIPKNRDRYGLTFFTRPQLNLTKNNLRNVRLFAPLLNNDPYSYQKVIRSTLDPRMQPGWGEGIPGAECPLVDNQQAFIPLLTNNIKTISGWKDIEVPSFAAKEGQYREGYSMVDGITVDYTSYTLTASFRNMIGDPITSMFFYWTHYMANVFEGTMLPYPDYIIENMLDYCTRIYRLVLDKTRTKVQAIAATGASYPTAVPLGQKFDFAIDQPYNDGNADIAIPFQCMGTIYNDDILIFEFNQAVVIFNSDMANGRRESAMVQIPEDMKFIFNNRGYARINPNTYALEWWIHKEDFQSKMGALSELNKSLGGILPMNL